MGCILTVNHTDPSEKIDETWERALLIWHHSGISKKRPRQLPSEPLAYMWERFYRKPSARITQVVLRNHEENGCAAGRSCQSLCANSFAGSGKMTSAGNGGIVRSGLLQPHPSQPGCRRVDLSRAAVLSLRTAVRHRFTLFPKKSQEIPAGFCVF